VLWNAKIEALRNVGLEVLEIARERMSKPCSTRAAISTWHVKTVTSSTGIRAKKDLMPRLDRRLRDVFGQA